MYLVSPALLLCLLRLHHQMLLLHYCQMFFFLNSATRAENITAEFMSFAVPNPMSGTAKNCSVFFRFLSHDAHLSKKGQLGNCSTAKGQMFSNYASIGTFRLTRLLRSKKQCDRKPNIGNFLSSRREKKVIEVIAFCVRSLDGYRFSLNFTTAPRGARRTVCKFFLLYFAAECYLFPIGWWW